MTPILLPLKTIYNNLTVIKNDLKINGSSACICKCSCGNITKPIKNYKLTSGNTKSCGCLKKETSRLNGKANFGKPSKKKDIKTGTSILNSIFGNLLVIKLSGLTSCRHELYECLCSCGETVIVNRSNLLKGNTKSCGCLVINRMKNKHRQYRISRGKNPDLPMTDTSISERNKLESIHKQVKTRDDFTCALCNIKGGILHTHHIIPFAENIETRDSLANLITLCKDCHINKAHSGSFIKIDKEIQALLQESMR